MLLDSDVKEIKGIGDKTAASLKKLHIETVKDLIFYIPRDFTLFEEPVALSAELSGKTLSFGGYMKAGSFSTVKKGRLDYSHVTFIHNGKNVYLTFFNMPYLKKQLDPSVEYVIRGQLEVGKNGAFSMTQPKLYTLEQYSSIQGSLQPMYPLTKGLSNNIISKAVKQVIDKVDIPDDGLDDLKEGCISFAQALSNMHFPINYDAFILARERIVFHEFVSFILQMKTEANETRNISFDKPLIETADTVRLLEQLPYKLTNAQKKAWADIRNDLESGRCMNRMVQGDVGSGKTIIAFLALIMNAANGYQGVLMAPTEVLAKQHYEKLVQMKAEYKLNINPILLLGSMSAKDKKSVYTSISSSEVNIIIGTHAVFQNKVEYKHLTMVVTDEQHRFGVKQREAIVNKGEKVHLLVMSATPIPRSLAMIMYGDIDLSLINELPANRLPIKNCVVGKDFRKKSYEFIEKEVHDGHQAYVICPQVEEGLDDNLENVVDYAKKLSSEFPSDIITSYLHGKMSLEQKDSIMQDFKDKKIDVLVSTTVIEVGIDVPNATVIMIENAERFGLAQLHQLRGRVGRGDSQSYCIFLSTKNDKTTMERLNVLNSSNDGFKIADEDLKLRGPGDLFGVRQSGEFGFTIGDIYNDSKILRDAADCVNELFKPNNQSKLDAIIAALSNSNINSVDFRTI